MKKEDRFYYQETVIRDWTGEIVIEGVSVIPYAHEDFKAIEKQIKDYNDWKESREMFWMEYWKNEKDI